MKDLRRRINLLVVVHEQLSREAYEAMRFIVHDVAR